MVICLEQGADLHTSQLMPLPLTVSWFSKIQIAFTFLVPAHPGSPGQRAVKRVCVYCSSCHHSVGLAACAVWACPTWSGTLISMLSAPLSLPFPLPSIPSEFRIDSFDFADCHRYFWAHEATATWCFTNFVLYCICFFFSLVFVFHFLIFWFRVVY